MPDVPLLRLRHQRLIRPHLPTPAGVVGWLGAVQAQEYPLAKWGLGVRGAGFRDADVEAAVDRGEILRTHVMRPTWHFVAPADIRWLLALTGPRVLGVMASYFRKEALDRTLFLKGTNAIERALRDGQALTRRELGAALGAAGISARGTRLAFFTLFAELEAVICNGPRRGSQHTYMLLEERVPTAPRLTGEEAEAELVRRYFTSHGPATLRDCAWWSGLTQATITRGIAALGGAIACVEIDGLRCWYARRAPARRPATPVAHLLPIYDECLIAYQDRGFIKRTSATPRTYRGRDLFNNYVMIDGRLAGGWRVAARAGTAAIAITPYDRLSGREKAAIRAAADRYCEFIERPLVLTGI